jgi:hypothetical protein
MPLDEAICLYLWISILYKCLYVDSFIDGEFHDQGDAKWIVISRQLRVITIRPLGTQPVAGISAARGLATLQAYLVVSITIN